MKKIISILTLLSVLAINSHSQQIKNTIFGAGAGLSLPYAEFASKSLTVNSGFASAGFNAETSSIRYTGRFSEFNHNRIFKHFHKRKEV
ncbi:MAG: hypothetical protein IPI69_08040 [Bacteroidales bacterium]|nr:hypothetical protein [Bacteroidales bacterium]